MLKKPLAALTLGVALFAGQAMAADYAIDKQGQHAFVNFKISHLATAGCTAPSRISTVRSAMTLPTPRRARST